MPLNKQMTVYIGQVEICFRGSRENSHLFAQATCGCKAIALNFKQLRGTLFQSTFSPQLIACCYHLTVFHFVLRNLINRPGFSTCSVREKNEIVLFRHLFDEQWPNRPVRRNVDGTSAGKIRLTDPMNQHVVMTVDTNPCSVIPLIAGA